MNELCPDEYLFNIGPPMRHESIAVKSSLFKESKASIRWKIVEMVGLDFEGRSPIDVVEHALAECGFDSSDDLLNRFTIPQMILACRAVPPSTDIPKVSEISKENLLRHALILGLCGPSIYDPQRPIIWTNNRLGRAVQLYETGRFFYANQ
jgi:hypothetical protein